MRRLFNLLAAMSLLLFVVVGVLWIRNVFGHSDFVQMHYEREPSTDKHYGYYFEASSYWNTLRFRFSRTYLDPPYFQNRSARWMHDFRVGWKTGFHIYVPSDLAKEVMDWDPPGFDAAHYAGNMNPGEYGQILGIGRPPLVTHAVADGAALDLDLSPLPSAASEAGPLPGMRIRPPRNAPALPRMRPNRPRFCLTA